MGISMLDVQHDAIISAIRDAGQGQWKILVVDEASWKLVSGVVKEDDILNQKIMTVEHIEDRRQSQRDTDAIYLLSPEPHVVDCLMADFEKRRYRRATLLWTSLLHAVLRKRIDETPVAREQIAAFQVVDIGYHPRESSLITFRDPWSFPILFHRGCDNLIKNHLATLSQKIVSVCVSLGEYPKIRYFKPPRERATYDASVLCAHLSGLVQKELDMYATYHQDFPPQSSRPRGVLYILDRSIDLIAPLVHEFTYQSMVHDLLAVKEGDRVTYPIKVNEGRPDEQSKEAELSEKDRIWTANRHRHMKDTIDKLMGDFQKFMDENPHFTKQDAEGSNSLNAIKDMLAGLPQFQEMKEAYSLHLTMAQESMNIFQRNKLADLASVEQSLATGLDEDYKKPKNIADQVVRMLDEEAIQPSDRLRLLTLYLLYRDGLLPSDTSKLIHHAGLPLQDNDLIANLSQLGANTTRTLKDPRPKPPPLFPPPAVAPGPNGSTEDLSLSRFQPALKHLLTAHCTSTLSPDTFPYTKPELDPSSDSTTTTNPQNGIQPASLRSAKPTWATTGRTATSKPKQRVLVFMAGGATYSESRACYETSSDRERDVYLISSHMLTPSLFVRQMRDLSLDPRRLGIPALGPVKKAPGHLWEDEPEPPKQQQQQQPQRPPQQQQQQQQRPPQQQHPPTQQMANVNLDANGGAGAGGRPGSQRQGGKPDPPRSTWVPPEEREKEKEGKKRGLKKLFGKG